jgi:hypothetical protein
MPEHRETVEYVYSGPLPRPCQIPPSITTRWANEVTVTHTISVAGSFTASLGLELQYEIGIKRLLAARTALDAGSMAQVGASWTGEWREVRATATEVQVGICSRVTRTVRTDRVTAHWETPVGQRFRWRSVNQWGEGITTDTDCEVGAYKGEAVGFTNRFNTYEVEEIRRCPTDCI